MYLVSQSVIRISLLGALILFAPIAAQAQLPDDWQAPTFTLATSSPAAQAAFEAGHSAWLEADWVGATRSFEQAIAADPDFQLARAFHAAGIGGNEAVNEVDRAITLARTAGLVEQLVLHGLREDALGRSAAATHMLSAATRLAPTENWLLANYYRRLVRDPETSIAIARELVDREPESYRSQAFLVLALRAPTDSAEALAATAEALRLGPDRPVVHWAAGKLMANLGRFEEAAEHYGHAVGLNPAYYQAQIDAAEVAMFTDQYDEARHKLEQALPKALDVRHRGMIRRVIAQTPMYHGDIDGAHQQLAEAAAATEAEGAFEEASLTYRLLAQIAAVQGDSAGVARYIAKQERPGFGYTSLDYWSTLAWYFAGEPALARQYLEKHAREMKTGDTTRFDFALNIVTGAVLAAEGNHEEALAVLENETNLFAVVIKAQSLRELGQDAQADQLMQPVYKNTYGLGNWVTPLAHWKRQTGGGF